MRIHARNLPSLGAAAIMILIAAIGALRYEHFATIGNAADLLSSYGFVIIAAAGATLVILMGGIDLSVGSVAAFSGVLMAVLVGHGWHPLAAACVCISAGAVLGGLMGLLIQAFELPAFMVTLAGMFAVRGAAFMLLSSTTPFQHPFLTWLLSERLHIGGSSVTWPSIAGLVVILAAWLVARWTPLGQRIYAIGGTEKSARMMGVPIGPSRVTIYAIAGMCSALAGCALAMDRRTGDPAACVGLELTVIAAVVIGGTLLSGGVGSVLGTLVGVLIIGLIRMMIDFDGRLSAAWTSIATGGLLLGFIVLQKLIASPVLRARLKGG